MQRHMPFGYKMIDGAITVESEKAELVRKMFSDYIAGTSLLKIAKELTQQGVPNANRKPSWNHGSIGRILSNCKYIGDNFYPAIVTEKIFNTAKECRKERNKKLNRNINYYANGITSTYVFSGKVICGKCGSIFRRYTEHHDKNKKCNWKCKRYIVDNRVCCKSGVVDDHQLEAAFIEIINQVLQNPEVIELQNNSHEESESLELKKIAMEIANALDESKAEASKLICLLFKKAAEQYRVSVVDDFDYQTGKLKKIFYNLNPLTEFNEHLFRSTIKRITVEPNGMLQFELINGIIFSTTYKQRGKGRKN